ncbi:hypothetical protein AO373_0219 [Moraxella catarrhalis]|nr:hypothetical protein AO373_0219 [Moraxella catarrhalis]
MLVNPAHFFTLSAQQKTKPFQVWFLWQLLKLDTKNISL